MSNKKMTPTYNYTPKNGDHCICGLIYFGCTKGVTFTRYRNDCKWCKGSGVVSIKNMKPVWRMNTGTRPKEDIKGLLCADKEICEGCSSQSARMFRWNFIGAGDDIIAYQTTRTREAKR
jgi:hypothetical protein